MRDEPIRTVPKGLSRHTLELVEAALRKADEPLSADEIDHATGVSRVAARRYLRFLVNAGTAEMAQEYGTPG